MRQARQHNADSIDIHFLDASRLATSTFGVEHELRVERSYGSEAMHGPSNIHQLRIGARHAADPYYEVLPSAHYAWHVSNASCDIAC